MFRECILLKNICELYFPIAIVSTIKNSVLIVQYLAYNSSPNEDYSDIHVKASESKYGDAFNKPTCNNIMITKLTHQMHSNA